MSSTAQISHIVIDPQGRAWIDDTNVKVIEVVRDHLAYGWSPDEIRWQYPDLTLGQIYSALSFYHDHRSAMDAEIEASLIAAQLHAEESPASPLRVRLAGSPPR